MGLFGRSSRPTSGRHDGRGGSGRDPLRTDDPNKNLGRFLNEDKTHERTTHRHSSQSASNRHPWWAQDTSKGGSGRRSGGWF